MSYDDEVRKMHPGMSDWEIIYADQRHTLKDIGFYDIDDDAFKQVGSKSVNKFNKKGVKIVAEKKKTFTEKEKKEFKAKKDAEFNQLVAVAKNEKASSLSRRLAVQELKRIESRRNSYNKKNNPEKYAQDLRAKADRIAAGKKG